MNWSFITGDLFNLFVAYEVMLVGSYGSMMVGGGRAAGAPDDDVRRHQPDRRRAVRGRDRARLRARRDAQHGRHRAANRGHGGAACRRGDRRVDGAAGGLRAQGGGVSAVLLAARFLSGRAGRRERLLRRRSSPRSASTRSCACSSWCSARKGTRSRPRSCWCSPGSRCCSACWARSASGRSRRILSWHIISQVGYMVMGIGLAAHAAVAQAAVAATIFYVVHHIIVKSSLFLVGGRRRDGRGRAPPEGDGRRDGARARRRAGVLVAALSLAGMPPFSGFLAKLVVLRVGLAGGHFDRRGDRRRDELPHAALDVEDLDLRLLGRAPTRAPAAAAWRGPAAATAVLVVATVAARRLGAAVPAPRRRRRERHRRSRPPTSMPCWASGDAGAARAVRP